MTTFINVTSSSSHKLRSESLQMLKYLSSNAKYPTGFFWISNGDNVDWRKIVVEFSIFSNFASKLEGAKHSNITRKTEEATMTFVQFNTKYAKDHNMTYFEADESAARKAEYSDYKKKELEKKMTKQQQQRHYKVIGTVTVTVWQMLLSVS